MQITDSQVKTLLQNIPGTKQRRELADIISGQIAYQVYCISTDVYRDYEDLKRDDNGKIVLDKKGNAKTVMVKQLVREGCKGRHIANIYSNGRVDMTYSDGKAWLRSSRDRFDGFKGFQCWCGNDSLLAKQEMGHVRETAPTKDDLGHIWKNLQESPSKYPAIKGEQVIDGFMIKEVA